MVIVTGSPSDTPPNQSQSLFTQRAYRRKIARVSYSFRAEGMI